MGSSRTARPPPPLLALFAGMLVDARCTRTAGPVMVLALVPLATRVWSVGLQPSAETALTGLPSEETPHDHSQAAVPHRPDDGARRDVRRGRSGRDPRRALRLRREGGALALRVVVHAARAAALPGEAAPPPARGAEPTGSDRKRLARRIERGAETREVGRPEDDAISRGDVNQVEVDSSPRDLASEVGQ